MKNRNIIHKLGNPVYRNQHGNTENDNNKAMGSTAKPNPFKRKLSARKENIATEKYFPKISSEMKKNYCKLN